MANRKKTGGRAMGTPNKVTRDLRNSLKNIIFTELDNLPELMNKMEAKDRLEFLIKLMPFVLPKVEPVKHDINEPMSFSLDIDLEGM